MFSKVRGKPLLQEVEQQMEEQLDEVLNWSDFVERTVNIGTKEIETFKAGRLKIHPYFWKSIF